MLTRVTAHLESVGEGRCVLALPGGAMALEAAVPAYLAERLESLRGQTVTLHTMVSLESPNQGATFTPRLLAFGSEDERAFFNLFITVKRLGARKAMRALAAEPGLVASWIVAGDTKALAKLPEIGKSLAEAIVVELKGKAERYAAWEGMPTDPDRPGFAAGRNGASIESTRFPPAAAEAVEALVSLGETRPEAERRVGLVLARDAALDSAEAIVAAAFSAR